MRQFLLSIAITILMCSMSFAYDIGAQTKIQVDSASFIAVDGIADVAAVVSKKNQSLSIVDTKTNAILSLIKLAAPPSGLIVKDGRIIVSAVSGQMWLFEKTGEIAAMVNTDIGIVSLANGEGQTVIIASVDMVKSVDISKGEIRELLLVHGKNPKLYASQEKVLLTEEVNGNTSVSIFDKKSGNIGVTEIAGNVTSIGFDEQLGYFLATMSGKTALFLYDVNSGISVGEIETNRLIANVSVNSSTHTAVVASLADGNMIVIGLISKLVEKSYPFFDSIVATDIDPARNVALVALNTDVATVQLENPVPALDTIIPDSVAAGSEGFQLSILGKKFIKNTQAWFNHQPLGVLFDSNQRLKSDILPDELIYPGKVTILAENPPPGGGVSNPLTFNILTPIPQIAAVTPSAVEVNIASVVRVAGKNFLPNAQVLIDGKNVDTYFVSSIVLEAKVNAAMATGEGNRKISVINVGETTATSNIIDLKIASTAEIQALLANKAASPTLQKGSLKGRILNTRREPVGNVTISYKGISTKTDANGRFVLNNIPEGRRTLLIDGSTAVDTKAYYPAIPVTAIIEANAVTKLSFTPHLHHQKNHDFVNIDSTKDTVVTDPQMKGFELKIGKGNRIVGWDGKTNDKISMRTVPPDRLPIRPVPENSNIRTVTMFYFDKTGGGRPDKPVPFKSPNTMRLKPGEKAVLWYYDESTADEEAPNDWSIAGTGTVSKDGRYIVTDEGVGIPKFCCGATAWGGTPDDVNLPSRNGVFPTPGGSCGTGNGHCSAKKKARDPIDVATGYFFHNDVDMVIPGIIPVIIKRYYVNRLGGSAVAGNGGAGLGAFGKGMAFEYDWRVDTYGDVIRLRVPGGTFFDFALPDGYCYYVYHEPPPPGSYGGGTGSGSGGGTTTLPPSPVCTTPGIAGVYRNSNNPEFMGAKITIENGLRVLTTRDGWRYVFESAGGLISLTDRNDNTVTITRHYNFLDDAGYIVKITNAENQDIIFNQTADGVYFVKTNSIVAPDGRTVHYEYEIDPYSPAYPRLKKVVEPDGTFIQYGYDTEGRMDRFIDANGVTKFINTYDLNNRVVTQAEADGSISTLNYTLAGGRVTQTDLAEPNGAVTTWRFNASGYVSEYTTSDGTTTYNMDTDTNFITSITYPLNRTVSFTYYNQFIPLTDFNASHGLVHSVTDALNNTTSSEYESTFGLTARVTNALNKSTMAAHTIVDNKVTQSVITDPLNHQTTVNYNSFGLPVSVTDPNGNTSTMVYDTTKHSQVLSVADALGNSMSYTYDDSGRVTSVTDATGAKSSFKYDKADQIIESTDARGNSTGYTYDNNGNLKALTDVKGNITKYQYDGMNRLIKTTDRLGRSEFYAYYAGSEITPTTGTSLKSYTDKRGQTTTFDSYDLMGRLLHVTFADSSTIQFTYDTIGRPTAITDSLYGTISFTYDVLDRVVSETTAAGTITYAYDAIGRRTSMTLAGEPIVNYGYDDASRPTEISKMVGGILRNYALGYDNGGRRTSLQVPLLAAGDKIDTSYGFDTANRLQAVTHQSPMGTLESISYTSDPNGNRTSMGRGVSIPQAMMMNGTSYNAEYEMLSYNGNVLTYDENGNLTTKTDSSGNVTTYTWNARDRLVAISAPTTTPSLSATFQYDAVGRRISKTINGVTTTYIYDGADIIRETTNGVNTNYIRTLGVDEPLSKVVDGSGSGAVSHYVKDGLGSTIGLVDDAGNQVSSIVYDAYGMTGSVESFGFTGREKDDGTGLMYYRSRYYSPEMGRFISRDPMEFEAGDANFYGYVGQNPGNFIDPFGLVAISEEEARNRLWSVIFNIDGNKIWLGTNYEEVGDKTRKGVKGDCSGTTWGIFNEAGLPTPYRRAPYFHTNPRFIRVKTPQFGDVGRLDNKKHVVIYLGNHWYLSASSKGDALIITKYYDNKIREWFRYDKE